MQKLLTKLFGAYVLEYRLTAECIAVELDYGYGLVNERKYNWFGRKIFDDMYFS